MTYVRNYEVLDYTLGRLGKGEGSRARIKEDAGRMGREHKKM